MSSIKYKPEHYKLVSIYDDAIDFEKSDFAAYNETLDLKHIVPKPGEKLSIVHLRNLPASLVLHDILREADEIERIYKAFKYSIVKIENPKEDVVFSDMGIVNSAKGRTVWEPTEIYNGKNGLKFHYISDDEFEYFAPFFIQEFGTISLGKAASRRGSFKKFLSGRFSPAQSTETK